MTTLAHLQCACRHEDLFKNLAGCPAIGRLAEAVNFASGLLLCPGSPYRTSLSKPLAEAEATPALVTRLVGFVPRARNHIEHVAAFFDVLGAVIKKLEDKSILGTLVAALTASFAARFDEFVKSQSDKTRVQCARRFPLTEIPRAISAAASLSETFRKDSEDLLTTVVNPRLDAAEFEERYGGRGEFMMKPITTHAADLAYLSVYSGVVGVLQGGDFEAVSNLRLHIEKRFADERDIAEAFVCHAQTPAFKSLMLDNLDKWLVPGLLSGSSTARKDIVRAVVTRTPSKSFNGTARLSSLSRFVLKSPVWTAELTDEQKALALTISGQILGGRSALAEKVKHDFLTESTEVLAVEHFRGVQALYIIPMLSHLDLARVHIFRLFSLPSILIPATVTKICRDSFAGCNKLSDVKFESGSRLAEIDDDLCSFLACRD
jgi:hypothetical protein